MVGPQPTQHTCGCTAWSSSTRGQCQFPKTGQAQTPVAHPVQIFPTSARRFEGQPTKDDVIITTGSEVGGLLVDGLGDGVLVEAPQLPTTELNFLRVMSFGLLQVSIGPV